MSLSEIMKKGDLFMYCIKCGSRLPDEAVFCGMCGYKVYNAEADEKIAVPSEEAAADKKNSKKKYSEILNKPIKIFDKYNPTLKNTEKGGAMNSEGNMRINGDILLEYYGEEECIEIPEGIKAIGKYAFFKNKTVKKVIMHDSLKYIGQYAFMECNNLEEVVFSCNTEIIGEKAFCNCKKLKNLEFPKSLRTLEAGSFAGCDEIENVSIPVGVETIPEYCFYTCKKLRSVSMADSVSEIGKFAFSHCLFLKNVEFSNSLRIIENSAFCYCKKIEELKFPASLFSIKGFAFFGCAGLSKVSVSMKLNNIKSDSFGGCDNLFKIHVYEFNDPGITLVEMRRGYKLILNMLKQISPERAKRYASENDINKLL